MRARACVRVCVRSADVPQPELMLTTTRGRATVAGLDSAQEYNLQVLLLNGTTEKLLAKRRFTSKRRREEGVGWWVEGRGGGGYMRKFFFLVYVAFMSGRGATSNFGPRG